MIFPFYEKALALFAKTQKQQIIKGLKKYPNAFNPHDWTPEELLNHALEETVDLTHYLVGLKDLLDVKDIQIKDLQNEIERLDSELRRVRRTIGAVPAKLVTGDPLYWKYHDTDDQH